MEIGHLQLENWRVVVLVETYDVIRNSCGIWVVLRDDAISGRLVPPGSTSTCSQQAERERRSDERGARSPANLGPMS